MSTENGEELQPQNFLNPESKPTPLPQEERERLVLQQMHQVRTIAHNIRKGLPENIDEEDLIHTGILGLIKAVDEFDSNMGAKLNTYAEYRIRGAILDSLRDMDWASRSRRKELKDKEAATERLSNRLGRQPLEHEIIAEMGISIEKYRALQLDSLAMNVHSLDQIQQSLKGQKTNWEIGMKKKNTPEAKVLDNETWLVMLECLGDLTEDEQLVIRRTYFDDKTGAEVATELGVTTGRVSQIKTKALFGLKKKMMGRGIKNFSINSESFDKEE